MVIANAYHGGVDSREHLQEASQAGDAVLLRSDRKDGQSRILDRRRNILLTEKGALIDREGDRVRRVHRRVNPVERRQRTRPAEVLRAVVALDGHADIVSAAPADHRHLDLILVPLTRLECLRRGAISL
jgi:hypothetical protein